MNAKHTDNLRFAGFLLAGALCAFGGLAGCNILGPVAVVVAGPPKIERKFELDGARPTVIFVDDRSSRVPQRSLRFTIAKEAETILMEKKVIAQPNMIGSQAAMQLAAAERNTAPLSIVDIGRAVGAEVVIYVTMEGWALSRDGASLSPIARGSVKVIDAKNNTRIWPAGDESGFPLVATIPQKADTTPTTLAETNAIHAALAHVAGLELARLFYTYERDQFSNSLKR